MRDGCGHCVEVGTVARIQTGGFDALTLKGRVAAPWMRGAMHRCGFGHDWI